MPPRFGIAAAIVATVTAIFLIEKANCSSSQGFENQMQNITLNGPATMAIQEGSSNIYWRYNDGYIEAAPGRRRDWKVWGSPGFKFIIGKLVEGERLCVTVTTDNRKRLIAKAPCPPRGRRLTVRLTDNRLFCKGYARCTDMCYFQFCSTGEYVAKDADDQMYLVKDFRKKWSMKCN